LAAAALPRTSPESQGLRSQAVLDFLDDIAEQNIELHSLMILRRGRVLAEGWWSPYAPHLRHSLYSLSKSFTATAIGMAVDEKRVSIGDRVVDFFPDKLPSQLDQRWQALTIKHLLTMTTGHGEDPTNKVMGAPDGDWVKAFFACPLDHDPGTTFVYNTAATYMLSAIIQRVTGEKLIDYLRPRLFDPLGIQDPTWWECPGGINTGGFGLNITTEDIAKFGQLFLDRGRWQGTQLVSEGWIAEASTKQVSNFIDDPASDWQQGYGYQMWMCRHGAYRGDGAFGQYCVVMPAQEAVIAITGGVTEMHPVLNSIWNHLLPQFGEPLPEDPAAHNRLEERLRSLSLPMLPGTWNEAAAAGINGQTYTMEPNPLGITSLEFAAADQEIHCTAWRGAEELQLKGGFGRYLSQHIDGEGLCQICCTWEDDATLTALARFVETPFSRTATLSFAGDELTVKIKQNCDFGPLELPSIKGRRIRRD
jgi:CubicO group peptidase (beta-lactamase class C family)